MRDLKTFLLVRRWIGRITRTVNPVTVLFSIAWNRVWCEVATCFSWGLNWMPVTSETQSTCPSWMPVATSVKWATVFMRLSHFHLCFIRFEYTWTKKLKCMAAFWRNYLLDFVLVFISIILVSFVQSCIIFTTLFSSHSNHFYSIFRTFS